ncbi:hypothetical protein AAG570_011924 [Ranatra chinensis]|uniref:C2H2-type domain-containing protein n=1 Tax=Ranatra chinensis TaxID=642074 RepID=A0ABD0YHF4_9HEMI
MVAHVKICTGVLYFCEQCNFKTRHSYSFTRHKRKHTNQKPYACSDCDYKTIQLSTLKLHCAKYHSNESPRVTNINGKEKVRRRYICKEGRIKKEPQEYICEHCDYRGKNATALKNHVLTHTGERPYGCHLCNYRAAQASALANHAKRHTGVKPYACPYCSYRAAIVANLRLHIMVHR